MREGASMQLSFTKMHGCGNDYIYINCFAQPVDDPAELAIRLSHRNFGIGGDGIILICPSEVADAKMRIFNIDGSEGRMCGNGIRCVAKYLYDHHLVDRTCITIETLSGIKTLYLTVEQGLVTQVRVEMGKASLKPADLPVLLEGDRIVGRTVEIAGGQHAITCVSMGNPHCVLFCQQDIDTLDLEKIGPKFEFDPLFPERVNTEFIQLLPDHTLKMRVWERGSGETMACGTGACASVVAAVENGYFQKGEAVQVHLKGGDLTICYSDEQVVMQGPATEVFEGVIQL